MQDLLIFIHIPKSAGTSFANGVVQALGPEQSLFLYGKHRTSEAITAEIGALLAERRDAIKFIAGHQVWHGIHELFPGRRPRYMTFLRDPVARVVSDYYKILRTPANELHEPAIRGAGSLESFVRGALTPYVVNHMTVFLGRDVVLEDHNAEQCVPGDDALLARAEQRLRDFWFVGLTESYAADLAVLRDLTGLAIPELNVHRTDRAGRRQIDRKVIETCARSNQMDAYLYHLAALIHDDQAPARLWTSPSSNTH
jgi:hypothetical protein